MDLQKEKLELIKMLMTTEDKETLADVKSILKRDRHTSRKSYPPELIASIERGLEQIKKGQTIPDKEVQKLYAKWL